MLARQITTDRVLTSGWHVVLLLALGVAAFLAVSIGMGVVPVAHVDSVDDLMALAFAFCILLVPFALIAILIALVPTTSWWRMTILISIGYVLIAAALGMIGYISIPAYIIVEDGADRGTNQSLGEMHDEEMMYAERDREADPARYAFEKNRVTQDRIRYFTLWIPPAVSGVLMVVGAALWFRRSGSN